MYQIERMEETLKQNTLTPPHATAGGAYGHGWETLKKYFLELLLLTFILMLIDTPFGWFNKSSWSGDLSGYNYDFTSSLYSLLYWLLIAAPVEYGVIYLFLKAVRGEPVVFKDILQPFNQFVDVVLANILVTGIVIAGFVFFIIPGIVFAIKLVFVPFLVMDRKMDAISAVKESWRMTGGYGWTIFGMSILAFFICLGGIIVFIVGIIVALMWIGTAFASLYYAVDAKNGESGLVSENNETSK